MVLVNLNLSPPGIPAANSIRQTPVTDPPQRLLTTWFSASSSLFSQHPGSYPGYQTGAKCLCSFSGERQFGEAGISRPVAVWRDPLSRGPWGTTSSKLCFQYPMISSVRIQCSGWTTNQLSCISISGPGCLVRCCHRLRMTWSWAI